MKIRFIYWRQIHLKYWCERIFMFLYTNKNYCLLIKMHDNKPFCIERLDENTNSFAPLTSEKIDVCKKLGINIVDISK